MRSYLLAAALGFAPSVFATLQPRQTATSTVPDCVVACIASSTQGTSCATNDAKCVCGSAVFVSQVAQCLATTCSAEDATTGIAFGEGFCESGGVTISIPADVASVLATVTGSSTVDASASNTAEAASSSVPPSSAVASGSASASSIAVASAVPSSPAASTVPTGDADSLAPTKLVLGSLIALGVTALAL